MATKRWCCFSIFGVGILIAYYRGQCSTEEDVDTENSSIVVVDNCIRCWNELRHCSRYYYRGCEEDLAAT
jgi:cephalosporin-C deacetylase-like acetyl esterase